MFHKEISEQVGGDKLSGADTPTSISIMLNKLDSISKEIQSIRADNSNILITVNSYKEDLNKLILNIENKVKFQEAEIVRIKKVNTLLKK